MLKIVYQNCCGLDVHKTFVVACLAITDGHGITTYKRHRFSTFTNGLRSLADWLELYSCFDLCMESTGKYWIPVHNILEKRDIRITLAHPKYVKAIRGKKTDKKDAQWIADLFKHDLVAGSFMPPADIRQLRDLLRYRFKLTNFTSSEKNQFQNSLTVSNIQLASVVSDTFGKSASKIIERILENPLEPDVDLPSLIHGSLKKKLPELELAIDGVITPEQAEKMKLIKQHYEQLVANKQALETIILELAKPYAKEIELIQSTPGFGSSMMSSISVISEIGVDMTKFYSAKHLCSWAGLTPTNNESAGKKHSVRISRAGCYLKPLLVQIANAVVRSPKHPEIRNRYLALKKRRGHKRAIIAIARQLLTAIYHMLSEHVVYTPPVIKEQNQPTRAMTVEAAIQFAKQHGFRVTA